MFISVLRHSFFNLSLIILTIEPTDIISVRRRPSSYCTIVYRIPCFSATVADVRRKWSHIRNSYSRHLRNEMHGACTSKGRMVSRWYLADELDFLRDHMATDM